MKVAARRLAVPVLLLVACSACRSEWHEEPKPWPSWMRWERARVTTSDSKRFILWDVEIRERDDGPVLVGHPSIGSKALEEHALADVTRIQSNRVESSWTPVSTSLTFSTGVAISALVLLALVFGVL